LLITLPIDYGLEKLDLNNKMDMVTSVISFDVLPIYLTSFSVTYLEGHSLSLTWETGSGSSGSHFEIEKSLDAITFTAIGKIPFDEDITSYSFIDINITHPVQFYRLKMIDIDGDCSYSHIQQIRTMQDGQHILLFPNPNEGHFSLSIPDPIICEEITCELFNTTGQKVKKVTSRGPAKEVSFSFDKIIPGMYFLEIYADNRFMERKRIVIVSDF
jgi:hypothetical protein